jgi:hypothetical protein
VRKITPQITSQPALQAAFNAEIISALNAFDAGQLFAGFVLQVLIGGVIDPRRALERDLPPALPAASELGAELTSAVSAVLSAKLPEKLLVILALRAPAARPRLRLWQLWPWLSQAFELPSSSLSSARSRSSASTARSSRY